MHTSFAPLALAAGAAATAVPAISLQWASGFTNPTAMSSTGGSANCVQGNISVFAATTKNLKLNLPIAANQTVVVETLIEQLMAGSTFMQRVVGGPVAVNGTFNINARICWPKTGVVSNSIQILTHGIGFDKSYWDVAANYSYVDVAAQNGYPTLAYDRLGVGLSDHPAEANSVLQAPLEVEVAHSLIQMLRHGKIAGIPFTRVVAVGHSFGSAISQSITSQYPTDVDAVVLTGFTTNSSGIPTFQTALDLTIASQNDPKRFGSLNNGYLVTNNIVGNQFAFFKAQGFPYSNLVIAEQTKQTVSYGEFLTLNSVIAPATKFTGAIDVVNGDSDWPFCTGNCSLPVDLSSLVKPMLYPAASALSQTYLAKNCGHGINLHYAAGAAYNQIQAFIKKVGL